MQTNINGFTLSLRKQRYMECFKHYSNFNCQRIIHYRPSCKFSKLK